MRDHLIEQLRRGALSGVVIDCAVLSGAAVEIERLQKALEEIADPNFALLASTKADIARKALQDQQERNMT